MEIGNIQEALRWYQTCEGVNSQNIEDFKFEATLLSQQKLMLIEKDSKLFGLSEE